MGSDSATREWLTPDEVAVLVGGGVTVWTVRKWIRKGYLPAWKVGPRRWRVSRVDAERFLRAFPPEEES